MTKGMLAWRIAWIAAVVVGCAVFAYSPSTEAQAAVLALASVLGLYLFWRGCFVR